MKTYSKENKKFWDSENSSYSNVWLTLGRQEMSKKELNFIKKRLSENISTNILDVGVGNGRILENLVKFSSQKARIYGIDVSSQMVNICKDKFKNENKIKKIEACDLSQESLPFKESFDFVTMIRVLKYNKEWHSMIRKIYEGLNPEGVYIFTMPNKISVSGLSRDTFSEKNLPILYTSKKELKKILTKTGFKKVEILAFSKLPNFLYHICGNKIYVKSLLFVEKALEIALGKSLLGRELFVLCVK